MLCGKEYSIIIIEFIVYVNANKCNIYIDQRGCLGRRTLNELYYTMILFIWRLERFQIPSHACQQIKEN